MSISPARRALLDRAAVSAAAWPNLPISPEMPDELDARDVALLRASEHALLRHWRTIGAVVRACCDRNADQVEAPLRGALFAATAQLVYLDRVGQHAIIHETVTWARENVRPGADGFVNAVLRRVQSLLGPVSERIVPATAWMNNSMAVPLPDGRIRLLKSAIFSRSMTEQVAEQASIGLDLTLRWREMLGDDLAHQLMDRSLVVPPVTVMGLAELDTLDPELAHTLQPHSLGGYVFHGDSPDLRELLASAPGARVQDPASAMAVESTRGLEPQRILDLCAGRGTKTVQLLATHPEAIIVACDPDYERARALKQRVSRESNVHVMRSSEALEPDMAYDLILLDVPCSNTGVLSRRLEARYRWTQESLDGLVRLQDSIVSDALPALAPKGNVLWSTCSVDPEENEARVEAMCGTHSLEIVQMHRHLPTGRPGDAPTHISNGSFHALLRRS